MSFLAPLFLLGGLAIAGPIIFHLIRRTTRDKLPFSSLMFLSPTPPRLTKRSRLEHLLLLALRCLVLLLLAIGFSRPFLQKAVSTGATPGSGRQMLVLIDTSASMQREDLWTRAQAKALETARSASPVDELAVFTFDRSPKPLVTFEEWNSRTPAERIPALSQRLSELSPGWESTDFASALMAAAETLADAASKKSSPGLISAQRIVLITDLQEGSRLESLQGHEWPHGIEVAVEQLQPAQTGNAGLQRVAETDDLKPQEAVAIRVRVVNSIDSTKEQFQLRWMGEDGPAAEAVPVYVPAGQSRIVQAPKAALTGNGRLVLTGDDHPFDNTVHVSSTAAEEIEVLFFGEDSPRDPNRLLFYLHRAFQETSRQKIRIRVVDSAASPRAGEFENAQLAIVHRPPSEPQRQALMEFLNDGKIVLVPVTSRAQTDAVAAFLPGFEAEEAQVSGYAMLGQITFEHPIFSPFADPRFSDFTKIHFWKYRRFSADAIPGARVLARFDSGDPALAEFRVGDGSLLVLASGWHPADSQLALSSKFVPLLYSILELSSGTKPRAMQFFVGNDLPVSIAPGDSAPVMIKPGGERLTLEREATRFANTDAPGLYTLVTGGATRQFAVNLHPNESRTAPLSIEELQRIGVPLKSEMKAAAPMGERERRRLAGAELEGQQKLWRWLIVVALMVLMLESWLAGRASRSAAATGATI
jgi:hypothetical protein